MTISNAYINQYGIIVAEIDGETVFIPNDMENTDRVKIDEWVSEGNELEERSEPASRVTIVSKAQAKLALLEAGLLDQVEETIAGMTGVAGQKAKIEWADRTEFHRDHEFIVSLAGALGLSDEQVDGLFERASQL